MGQAQPLLAYLCGILNSFTIDYVQRFKVNANVNKFHVYQPPIPPFTYSNPHGKSIAHRVAKLICIGPDFDDLRQELMSE